MSKNTDLLATLKAPKPEDLVSPDIDNLVSKLQRNREHRVAISALIKPDLLRRLEDLRTRSGRSLSSIIETAIDSFLNDVK